MIRLFHVFKRFGANSALNDVTLEIDQGEFVFITGPSGAGKSTLLRIIFGAEQPTSGQVLVNSVNFNRIRRQTLDLLRRKIGFVFQDFKLLNNRTVLDNVAVALLASGERGTFVRKRTRQALKLVGLSGKEKSFPRQLSGGEQQRVAIARAIVNKPVLLLADEPTGNLDPDLTRDIMVLLRSIHLRGTTVLIATHSRELLNESKRRRIVLNRGVVVEDR
ncbi:MAG: cell division ATP-binding protein FtsE [Desulfatiglandaceae bacterium]